MPRRNRITFSLAGGVVVAALVTGGYLWGVRDAGETERRAEVARRGAAVMPFALQRTTHVFAKRSGGGVQTVVADDPDDSEQVALVRAHLGAEAEKFRRGELDDPGRIHGMEMPGMAELEAGAGRIEIVYADIPAGGQIRYRTNDRSLVSALHAWFDAQVSDHGADAEPG